MAVELFTSLNNHNVDYWADFGTLLGIVREDDIIWKDNDVDVVVVNSNELDDKITLVRKDLEKKGYNTKKHDWSAYGVSKWGQTTDLYINSIDRDKKVYVGATGENSDIPIKFIGNCTWITWKKGGVQVRVPEHVHEALVWRYGEDYMTPIRNSKGRDQH